MLLRILPGGALAAIAGAGMLFLTAAPSTAFTLSSPSLDQPVVNGQVEKVWWDRWGYWHPNRPWGWRRWGYWGPHYYYYHPYRHCWRGRWGALHCRWW
jgi:hypothetical protein